jgi:4-amino-4-deoxy-L-arabinose transferase-like glycosyltransferase
MHDRSWSLLVLAAFGVLGIVLFASAMVAPLPYDEEQYIAGSYFAMTLSPYRDFISLQPPLFTWLHAALFALSDGWYVLTARIAAAVLGITVCVLLYSLLRSLGADRFASFVLVLAFVTSPFLRDALGHARNDLLPLCLLLAGWRLMLAGDGTLTPSAARLAATGLAFSLATTAKYSYVFAAPIALAALVWLHWPRRPWRDRAVLGYVACAALGVLPLGVELAWHGERFVWETVRYHMEAMVGYYQEQGQGELLDLAGKLDLLVLRLGRYGSAALAAVIVGAMAIVASRHRERALAREPVLLTLVAMLIAATLLALRVGPHAMYFVPSAALATLIAARLYAEASDAIARRTMVAFLVLCLLPAAPVFLRYGAHLKRALDPARWVGMEAHASAQRVAQLMAEHGATGHVATVWPTLVLDAHTVRPEFSAGPFFFRSADRDSPERVFALRGVGPATLEKRFASDPPGAILGGFGPFDLFNNIDAPLLEYAKRHGYRLVAPNWKAAGYENGQLWVRATK